MKLKEFSKQVEKILIDEELLRIMHYAPTSRNDDPLDHLKPNILDKPIEEKWDIIDSHLVSAIKQEDLQNNPTCKVFYYAGYGKPTNSNYLFANQEYVFDVLVPYEFQILDKRLEMICDRLNELIFNQRIGGIGKTLFRGRQPLINSIKDYVAFRLIYEFCNENY